LGATAAGVMVRGVVDVSARGMCGGDADEGLRVSSE
jgi:hypothetical protein